MDEDSCVLPLPRKAATTVQGTSRGLKLGRKAAVADTGYAVPQAPLHYFRTNLLPPLADELDVDVIVDRLIEAGDIVEVQQDDDGPIVRRWKDFPEDPSLSKRKEDAVFVPFATIANRVAFHTTADLASNDADIHQTVEFICNPTMTPTSTNRENTAKPDSYGVLLQRNNKLAEDPKVPHWDDIVIPGEKKKRDGDNDFNDNNIKIVWSLTHGMRETVQRRFMFGYTIEDVHMRIWFCSRSDIIVSEQFNFITNHSEIVHFFLSIMFANPTQLGYDPTITTVFYGKKQKENIYDITLEWEDDKGRDQKTVFRTTEVIANISAEAIRGRGTRVWRGYPLDDPETSIVIKDCWIDDDRKREADILADILDAAKKRDAEEPGATYVEFVERHFLEVSCHGDVLVGSQQDNTFTLMRRGADLPVECVDLPLQRTTARKDIKKGPVGTVTLERDAPRRLSIKIYHRKFHYRIIFKSEVACKPIDTVNSIGRLFTLLSEALIGITILHRLGWLHRDVSSGNLLAEGDEGPAKITDLEYCKRMDDCSSAHPRRTGTPYFIPVEIDRQEYLFGQDAEEATPTTASRKPAAPLSGVRERTFGKKRGQVTSKSNVAPSPVIAKSTTVNFTANPLHDLESLWWLAVYLTIPRRVEGDSGFDPAIQKQTEQWASEIFTDSASRALVMTAPTHFSTGVQSVHPHLKTTADALKQARKKLLEAYEKAERSIFTSGIDTKATMDLYPEFREIFDKLLDDIEQNGDVELSKIPITYLQPSTSTDASVVGGSLGPRAAPLILGKHPRNPEDDHDIDTVQDLTQQISALSSPSRGSRNAKRVKHESAEETSHSDEVARPGEGSGTGV